MGLSEQERFSGIAFAIDRVLTLVKDVELRHCEDYEYPKDLVNLIKQLWHAFIGSKSNASHWILGSSAIQEVTGDADSIWGLVAINYRTEGLLKDGENLLHKSDTYNVFDGFLDISSLLRSENKIYSFIYDVYAWNEQIIYYLRRYEDKFLKNNEELSKIVSNISGECFHLFKQSDVYAKAYILNAICKIIYTNKYPYDVKHMDSFTRFLVNDNGQHDLNRPMRDGSHVLKEMADIHVALHRAEKAKKLTVMMRVEVFLKIAGRKFYYDHKFNKLIECLKLKKDDCDKLKVIFLSCKKEHDEHNKQSTESYLSNKMSPLSIYGYNVE